ncbi:hypothetical protein [Naumannella halotolerans]|uniref:hypothetical protein n=1 Tax=Naumannella halotolerans TaxID=993414 RepID=UPI00105FEA01|nr:hypothetical protein [Naumannella halotolerans]
MTPPRITVVSAFEAELQPVAAATAAAALRDHGADIAGWDAHQFPEDEPVGTPDLFVLSVQQFEGLERALDLAASLVRTHSAPIVAFGQYAQMNARELGLLHG